MEALLAVAMLMVSALVMSSIYQTALTSQALSRDYLIAQNLATEAMEAVKIVRSTNLMLNPTNSSCWLMRDPLVDVCPDVGFPANRALSENSYATVWVDKEYWKLDHRTGHLSLENSSDATNNSFKLEPQIIDQVFTGYVHNPNYTSSAFYRSLKLVDIWSAGGDELSAFFEVTVQWKRGQKVHTIKRPFTIFNFEGF